MSLFIGGPLAGQVLKLKVEGKRYTAAIMQPLPLYSHADTDPIITTVGHFYYERHEFHGDDETLSVFAPEGWRAIDALKALFAFYAEGKHK